MEAPKRQGQEVEEKKGEEKNVLKLSNCMASQPRRQYSQWDWFKIMSSLHVNSVKI
jgi:hypothetical protein